MKEWLETERFFIKIDGKKARAKNNILIELVSIK